MQVYGQEVTIIAKKQAEANGPFPVQVNTDMTKIHTELTRSTPGIEVNMAYSYDMLFIASAIIMFELLANTSFSAAFLAENVVKFAMGVNNSILGAYQVGDELFSLGLIPWLAHLAMDRGCEVKDGLVTHTNWLVGSDSDWDQIVQLTVNYKVYPSSLHYLARRLGAYDAVLTGANQVAPVAQFWRNQFLSYCSFSGNVVLCDDTLHYRSPQLNMKFSDLYFFDTLNVPEEDQVNPPMTHVNLERKKLQDAITSGALKRYRADSSSGEEDEE